MKHGTSSSQKQSLSTFIRLLFENFKDSVTVQWWIDCTNRHMPVLGQNIVRFRFSVIKSLHKLFILHVILVEMKLFYGKNI